MKRDATPRATAIPPAPTKLANAEMDASSSSPDMMLLSVSAMAADFLGTMRLHCLRDEEMSHSVILK